MSRVKQILTHLVHIKIMVQETITTYHEHLQQLKQMREKIRPLLHLSIKDTHVLVFQK